ncbi:MAG: MarR family winged helix-turn-helix transcriptional regulator [Planctomycetota bacterium]|jgi:DNA-binding MarR family transcriptional regulator
MGLKSELKLSKDFISVEHEALLNLYYTSICIKKHAAAFFASYDLTDVQFNLMMLIKHHGGDEGLSQARLSEMMMVNRANVTGLIDRLEKIGVVRRTAAEDRRYNMIQLTAKGLKRLDMADPAYGKEVQRAMSVLSKTDLKRLIKVCEKLRGNF